jgi:hypothetical protein
MQTDYYINDQEVKAKIKPVAARLALIAELMSTPASRAATTGKELGRNFLTRTLDVGFALVRKYALPVHWLGVVLSATVLFIYARLVALTGRVTTTGALHWPHVPKIRRRDLSLLPAFRRASAEFVASLPKSFSRR